MSLIKQLIQLSEADYNEKRGHILSGGVHSKKWSREDIKLAVEEIKKSDEFEKLLKLGLKFNSTARELANGTISFSSAFGSDLKVYLGGQLRAQSTEMGGNRLTRLKSPKPQVIEDDLIGTAVLNYKDAMKALLKVIEFRQKKARNAGLQR
jgi:hypothetical protein